MGSSHFGSSVVGIPVSAPAGLVYHGATVVACGDEDASSYLVSLDQTPLISRFVRDRLRVRTVEVDDGDHPLRTTHSSGYDDARDPLDPSPTYPITPIIDRAGTVISSVFDVSNRDHTSSYLMVMDVTRPRLVDITESVAYVATFLTSGGHLSTHGMVGVSSDHPYGSSGDLSGKGTTSHQVT